MRMNELELKKLMLEIGKRLWTKGWVASNDGNISVRLNDNEILTTPTGVSKGFMTQDMLLKVNMDGTVISRGSSYRPSSEVKMHIDVYRQRDDIMSAIHAHPPYCTSFAVAGIPLDKCVLPEAIITLGAVPIAPYGTPSTVELPDQIKPHIKNSDTVLLANHGALTLGIDLMTAYHRMETLEHTATIVYHAIQLGNVNIIPTGEVRKLLQLREKMNLPGKINISESDFNRDESGLNREAIEEIIRGVLERIGTA